MRAPGVPTLSPHHRSGRLAPLASLAALVMVVALIWPSTYLIARRVPTALDEVRPALAQFTGSPDREPDPKRPKGISHHETRPATAFVSSMPARSPSLRPDAGGTGEQVPLSEEAAPAGSPIPPQLLQRPPPHEGHPNQDFERDKKGLTR